MMNNKIECGVPQKRDALDKYISLVHIEEY
jgi:hypothetical protein